MQHDAQTLQVLILIIKLLLASLFIGGLVSRRAGRRRSAKEPDRTGGRHAGERPRRLADRIPGSASPLHGKELQADPATLVAEAADPVTPEEQLQTLARNPTLAATVAANPSAPASLLRTLSASWDPDVWRAVVCNPNVAPDTLLQLAPTYPAECFANPVLPLLLLEQPSILLRRPRSSLSPLIQHPDAPAGFLSILTNHDDEIVVAEARMHVNLAGEPEDTCWEREAEAAIWRFPLRYSSEPLCTVLQMGGVAPWLIAPLVLHGDEGLRRGVARSPGLPRTALEPFRRAGARVDLVGYAMPDPTLDTAVLDRLSRGGVVWTRGLAARHPSTSSATLSRLTTDGSAEVRRFAAGNAALPESMLNTLAHDANSAVRQAVARSPRVTVAQLERLARDSDWHVRGMVAGNPSAPPDVLLALTGDAAWQVRRQAARHLNTPAEAWQRLVMDPERLVRYAVARRTDLAPAHLEQLAIDADPIVRRLVACLPALPAPLRERLHVDLGSAHLPRRHRDGGRRAMPPKHVTEVRPGTLPVPSSPQEHHQQHLGGALQALLAPYVDDPIPRAIALAHPATPAVRLSEHVRAGTWIERCAVARNPHVPRELLQILAQDTNRVVRAAARARRKEMP